MLHVQMDPQLLDTQAIPATEVSLAVELADAAHQLHRDTVAVVVRNAPRVPVEGLPIAVRPHVVEVFLEHVLGRESVPVLALTSALSTAGQQYHS